MASKKRRQLTDLEAAVMKVVWDLDECSAQDVRRKVRYKKRLAESTVRTLLRTLEQKGFVTRRVEGRTYLYRPLVPEDEAAATAVDRVVDRFFEGSMSRMVVALLDREALSDEEEAYLRDLLRRRQGEKGDE